MGRWEHKLELYLFEEVEKIGGTCRKCTCPNRVGFPDQIVFFYGFICLVEMKTFSGRLSSKQIREQKRLNDTGAQVFNLFSEHQIDCFVKNLREGVIHYVSTATTI